MSVFGPLLIRGRGLGCPRRRKTRRFIRVAIPGVGMNWRLYSWRILEFCQSQN